MTTSNKFPTSVDLNASWVRQDPEHRAKRKHWFQQFWGLCVPAGFGAAVIVALFVGSPDVFLPAWLVMTIVIWGLKSGLDGQSE